MTANYYDKKIYIPRVDEKDNFLGPIERWQAHEKGILHRAFTVAVTYKDSVICQHRKHPVFGGFFDLTASSHPQVIGEKIQSNEDAIMNTLKREWRIEEVKNLKHNGSVLYKTADPNSSYIEHEFCHFFTAKIDELPTPNYEVSYGFTLQPLSLLQSTSNPFYASLAPWVKAAFEKGLFKE